MTPNKAGGALRQVVDWGAVFWAGLLAGVVFLGINWLLLPQFVGGNPWMMMRLFGAMVLGDDVLPPPATFDGPALVAALGIHFAAAFAATALIALIVHRFGMFVGFVGGGLIGLALYGINIYTLTYFFPHMFVLKGTPFLLSHVAFGALAGGLYEAYEVERYVRDEPEVAT